MATYTHTQQEEQWAGQQQPQQDIRALTPAMNNTRYAGRYASAPRMGQETEQSEPYQTVRSMTPNGRGYSAYSGGAPQGGASSPSEEPRTPSSTGLIRLSLKKPMGIVFEPMYDPNKPSNQRGVRICDLPRTGAAALSRKLQVGDELLQINDTTVSRLTFDEIMDFIIEADPESVNLLFRRPRKETLQARQGVQQKLNAAANKDNPSTVKWVDEEGTGENKGKSKKKGRSKKKKSKRSKKESMSEEDETLQSKSTMGEDSYVKSKARRGKKSKTRANPYESESFLDMLIDSICSDSNNVCRDSFRRADDEYGSEDESFGTENEDDTYATYEESLESRKGKKSSTRKQVLVEEETLEESLEESLDQHRRSKQRKEEIKKKYEDDGTLESVESNEIPKVEPPAPQPVPPLGLAPNPPPMKYQGGEETDDDGNPAPIKELEYDDRIDHGADVSVMESLGGPSLLIEKQRAAQAAANFQTQSVPSEILEKYGLDYPKTPGLTREQTISADPLKFYTHVVKQLLEEHEPEKVRLLDKLLAKYKGREDHLIQKLSVRYNRPAEEGGAATPEKQDEAAFTDAVKQHKQSANAAAAVHTAKERMHNNNNAEAAAEIIEVPVETKSEWPEKETKEPEAGDEGSASGSEYSRDSVDGTSPAVIAQVSELLNYVYGKTSVPGQIDRVSTIMRAYEGREAVLLELLETKALIKANKEKENADNLPSFLRNTQLTQAQQNAEDDLPPVTPMANPAQGGTVINDDISSMSGVSSPQGELEGVEMSQKSQSSSPMKEVPKLNASASTKSTLSKPPVTPDKRKKKGLFGGLFGKKKTKDAVAASHERQGSRLRTGRNKLKGNKSVEGSI